MAIKVGGTEVVDNNRQLKNIASVDATTVAALGTAGVGGGGSHEFTAAETLSAGQSVLINSSGQLEKITQQVANATFQESNQKMSGDIVYFDVEYFPNANYSGQGVFGCLFYRPSNGYTYEQKNSVNATTGIITSQGDQVVISNSAYGQGLSLTYGSGSDKALWAMGYTSSNEINIRGVYYNGLTFNTTSSIAISHTMSQNKRIANWYDASHNKWFVSADRSDSGGNLPIHVISMGTGSAAPSLDFTHNINATGWSNNFRLPEIASDGNGQFVMAFYDAAQGYCRAIAFTLSGQTFSYGSIETVSLEAQYNDSMSLAYDQPSGKFVVTARNNTNGQIIIRSITVGSNNAITLGTSVVASPNTRANCLVDLGGRGVGLIMSIYTALQHRTVSVASNGNITLGTAVTITDSAQNSGWDTSRNITAASTKANLSGATSIHCLANYAYGNLYANEYHQTVTSTDSDFIGFTEGAISSGATGKVTVIGGINENQTGLTPGTKMYLSGSGSLTSSVTNVYAGRATAATKLLVKG